MREESIIPGDWREDPALVAVLRLLVMGARRMSAAEGQTSGAGDGGVLRGGAKAAQCTKSRST